MKNDDVSEWNYGTPKNSACSLGWTWWRFGTVAVPAPCQNIFALWLRNWQQRSVVQVSTSSLSSPLWYFAASINQPNGRPVLWQPLRQRPERQQFFPFSFFSCCVSRFLADRWLHSCVILEFPPNSLESTRKKKKMMRMITGLSDDTALFLVPAQSSVSNHRPKTNIQCFQESVWVLMTERSVQLTGSHHHRRVLQRLAGRRCKTVALVKNRNRPTACRALRAPFQPRTLCVETIYTYQLWRFKFGITAPPLGLKSWTFLQNTSEGSKYASGIWNHTQPQCFGNEKKKKKMRMISEAAVKFTFSSVSFKEHCQQGKNT